MITEHLDLWSAALMTKSASGRGGSSKLELYGLKKLRELILELAVRGLLVPQDPQDEPASALLKKIAEERKQLIKNGVIKKPKKLAGIKSDDLPFGLPEKWAVDRLGNLSHVITKGTTPTSIGFSFTESGISFIKIENLDRGRIDRQSITQYISEETNKALARSQLQEGDLLFSIAGTIGKTCIVHNVDLPANTNQALAIIRGTQTVCIPEYLRIQLDSFVSEKTRARARGGAMPNVSLGDLTELVLPVPPKAEQHRIVAKVEELMTLCDRLEARQEASLSTHRTLVHTLLSAITEAGEQGRFEDAWVRIAEHFDLLFTTEESIDLLKQSILQLAVMGKLVPQNPQDEPASVLLKKIAAEKASLIKAGKIKKQKKLPPIREDEKPFELSEGWEWTRLGNIVEIRGGKRVANGYKLLKTPTPYIYIRVKDMRDGTIDDSDLHYIDSDMREKIKRYIITKDDIYMTIVGATIGKCGLVPDKFDQMNLTENAARLIPLEGVDKSFLYKMLDSPFCQQQFYDKTKQVGVQKMALNRLATTLIPIPSTKEQHRIVARVDELMALCDRLHTRLRAARAAQRQLAEAVAARAPG